MAYSIVKQSFLCITVSLLLAVFYSCQLDNKGNPSPKEGTTCAIIIAGQSNAVGMGDTLDLTSPDILYEREDIYTYNVDNFGGTAGEFERLYPGINSNSEGKGFLGFETSLADELIQQGCPSVHILKVAYSASALGGAWQPGTRARREFENGYKNFLTKLDSSNLTPDWKAIIWMQGESDARQMLSRAEAYYDNLVEFFDWFRGMSSLDNNLITILKIHENPSEQPHQDLVRSAQERYVDAHPNYQLIDTDDIPRQGKPPYPSLHYTADGYLELGSKLMLAVK